MSSDAIELDYFTLFMTTELTEIIVVETNRYAAEIRAKVSDDKPHARIRSWKEVNSDSIWCMISNGLTGIVVRELTHFRLRSVRIRSAAVHQQFQ